MVNMLGELEKRVMAVLWAAEAPMSVAEVREVIAQDRPLAYTTIMTVLDRLAKKELVLRTLENRAWQYRPKEPQHIFLAKQIQDLIAEAPQHVSLAVLRELGNNLNETELRQLTDAAAS